MRVPSPPRVATDTPRRRQIRENLNALRRVHVEEWEEWDFSDLDLSDRRVLRELWGDITSCYRLLAEPGLSSQSRRRVEALLEALAERFVSEHGRARREADELDDLLAASVRNRLMELGATFEETVPCQEEAIREWRRHQGHEPVVTTQARRAIYRDRQALAEATPRPLRRPPLGISSARRRRCQVARRRGTRPKSDKPPDDPDLACAGRRRLRGAP